MEEEHTLMYTADAKKACSIVTLIKEVGNALEDALLNGCGFRIEGKFKLINEESVMRVNVYKFEKEDAKEVLPEQEVSESLD